MKMVHVTIRKNPMTTISKDVGAHEIPVLQALHGETAVHIAGFAGEVPTPNAEQEYTRLMRAYGVDNDRKASYAEIVYGRGPAQLAAALAKDERKKVA